MSSDGLKTQIEKLNRKQRTFATQYARTADAEYALKKAGYLVRDKRDVVKATQRLMELAPVYQKYEQKLEEYHPTLESDVMRRFCEIITNPDDALSLAAIKEYHKIRGAYAPVKSQNVTAKVSLGLPSEDE